MLERRNSVANALDLRLSCTNPSICMLSGPHRGYFKNQHIEWPHCRKEIANTDTNRSLPSQRFSDHELKRNDFWTSRYIVANWWNSYKPVVWLASRHTTSTKIAFISSTKYVFRGRIGNMWALVQVMSCCQTSQSHWLIKLFLWCWSGVGCGEAGRALKDTPGQDQTWWCMSLPFNNNLRETFIGVC